MSNTLRRITKACCITMIVIAAYSLFISIFLWRSDLFDMPAWDHFIFYNDMLMLAVGIIALRLGERLVRVKWFIKLSLFQAIASITCVTLIYIPKKLFSVGLYDIAYILSAVLSVAVLVCCVIARRRQNKEM